MNKFQLTRDVSRNECDWLDKDYKQGDIVYMYLGCTYGCITDTGEAFTDDEGKGPFFELPLNAVKEIT